MFIWNLAYNRRIIETCPNTNFKGNIMKNQRNGDVDNVFPQSEGNGIYFLI